MLLFGIPKKHFLRERPLLTGPWLNSFSVIGIMSKPNITLKQKTYNIDETGCAIVQVSSAIVTLKSKEQVGSITSGERSELVTIECVVSTAGNIAPPMRYFSANEL